MAAATYPEPKEGIMSYADPVHAQHVATQDGGCRRCFPDMPEAIVPTPDNRGLLPVGSRLADGATIHRTTLTGYWCDDHAGQGAVFRSFDQVHGRPQPASPLVVLG